MLDQRSLPVDLEHQARVVFEGVKRTVAAAMQVEVVVGGRGKVLEAPPGKRRQNHVRATTVPTMGSSPGRRKALDQRGEEA